MPTPIGPQSPSFVGVPRPASAAGVPAAPPAPASPAAAGERFTYADTPMPGLGAAVAWRPKAGGMTGTQANLRVTDTYQRLDVAMTRYLGEPQLPNWMTFGKYASREVGGQVVRLEEMMKVSGDRDPEAAIDTLKDFMGNGVTLSEQGLALLKVSRGNPLAAVRNATAIRDALVAGNTGVYADIAPAYDVFLKAEAAGQDGVAALRAGGWGRAPKDDQGLLLEAFGLYQRAVREKDALTPDQRKALIHRATLTIGNHEQMVVLQGPAMFGNPEVARLLSSLSSQLSVTDARGTKPLLPHGGNWADFATRMGYDEVSSSWPGAMRVADHAGFVHHYAPSENPRRWEGTIGAYFASGLAPADAKRILEGVPAPLPSAYDDVNGLANGGRWILDRVKQGVDTVRVKKGK